MQYIDLDGLNYYIFHIFRQTSKLYYCKSRQESVATVQPCTTPFCSFATSLSMHIACYVNASYTLSDLAQFISALSTSDKSVFRKENAIFFDYWYDISTLFKTTQFEFH